MNTIRAVRRRHAGDYVTISTVGDERVRAFVPKPLPPVPPVKIDPKLRELLDRALLALGRLDSVTTLLPDTHLFLYMYTRKEAVLSSQIEGTQSSLSDLLLFEVDGAPGVPFDDVVEVSNYVAALEHGLQRIRDGFPLSNRLIREIHGILLSRGRGAEKDAGHFRRTPNWIGGTRPGNAVFVPPPPERIADTMSDLERWLHGEPEPSPILIRAAFAHVQFETIHPFLDGNGRVGRLLITLLLLVEGVLREPLLYLSLYLKENREEYYDLLQRVRKEGDWESWLAFFAKGVGETAEAATSTARRLSTLFKNDRARIQTLGRAAGSSLRVHETLERRPVADAAFIAKNSALSIPTVMTSLRALIKLGIVVELTGRQRGQIFSYQPYVKLLSEGTERP